MSLFDDFDWGTFGNNVLKQVPAIVSTVAGRNAVTGANSNAANIAATTGAANTALVNKASTRGTALRQPAIGYFNSVMGANPGVLTPAQQQQIDDQTRTLQNGNLLGTVGGRSYSRTVADTTGRMRNAAVQANTQRADTAATQEGSLANQEANAQTQTANTLSGINTGVGQAAANAGTANASADNQAYGQIANLFANTTKDSDRAGRYDTYKKSGV